MTAVLVRDDCGWCFCSRQPDDDPATPEQLLLIAMTAARSYPGSEVVIHFPKPTSVRPERR